MNVSQPTLHRLLSPVYNKMTDAIVSGKALGIKGDSIGLPRDSSPACGKGRSCERGGHKKPLSPLVGAEAGDARIAITSTDGTLGGMVDERFGRARKLILYDLDTAV
jgi:hypothetical protein